MFFAFPVMLFMWGVQFKSLLTVTPRYFAALVTLSSFYAVYKERLPDFSYGFFFFSSFHIMPNINKLMILAYEERMLRVLFVVKSESM